MRAPAISLMRVLREKMRISEATGSCRLQADIQIAGLQSFNFA
jgi:hypothetical protein